MLYILFRLCISCIVLKCFFLNPRLLMGVVDSCHLLNILPYICDSSDSSLPICLIWDLRSMTCRKSWQEKNLISNRGDLIKSSVLKISKVWKDLKIFCIYYIFAVFEYLWGRHQAVLPGKAYLDSRYLEN